MAHDDLGFCLAISMSRRHMQDADGAVVLRAMSTRIYQLQKELKQHAEVEPDRWIELVVMAAHKILNLERKPMSDEPYIKCKVCDLTSYNPNDIREKFCGRCHKFHETPDDYELGQRVDPVDPALVSAVREHLSMEERAELHRAITDCADALIAKVMPHGGKVMSPQEWAQLVLSCAREALKEHDEKASAP